MKQKDIAVIISAAFMSGVFALVLSSAFVSSPKNSSQTAEVVQPITADFPEPDKKYFNGESIDPTQLIRIGESTNPTPFNEN